MAEKKTRVQDWLDEHGIDWGGIKDWVFGDPDAPSYDKLTKSIQDLEKVPKDDRKIKDYYDIITEITEYQKDPEPGPPDYGGMAEFQRLDLLDKMDVIYPDRGKGTQFKEFEKAYAEKDKDKKKKRIAKLRTQFDPKQRGPHVEKGRPFVESDVTEAILAGKLKRPEPGYEGPFGKLGEYFSKNAAARDKMFSLLGTMGREMVKPIEPGKEAAGALIPTISRGLGKGGEEYAAKQAAAAKTALDIASARQKISPLQYYSSKMQEARLMVPQNIGADTAEGKRWIGKYLLSIGIPSQVVDLTSSLDSLNLQLLSAPSDTEKKRIQGLIDQINRQIQDIVTQSIGGSSVTNIVPYNPVA